MGEGRKILKILHDAGVDMIDVAEIMKLFDEDLKVLAGDEYASKALKNNLKKRFEMNKFKYAFSMNLINDRMKKLNLPPVFIDTQDYDQCAKDYAYYYSLTEMDMIE